MNIIWYQPDIFHSNEKHYAQYGEKTHYQSHHVWQDISTGGIVWTNVVEVNNQLYCMD